MRMSLKQTTITILFAIVASMGWAQTKAWNNIVTGYANCPSSCPDDNHPHAIDLGLPSGTKWACCNVGAANPVGYGDYYAWGEMEEKDDYSFETYIHCDGTYDTCHNLGSDIAGTQYDVAHVKWGNSWVMPSADQIKELSDNCTHEWVTVNYINGSMFTSSINGNSIFLPASGRRSFDESLHNEGLLYVGSSGFYWSSTQSSSDSYDAYTLTFGPSSTSDCTIWIDGNDRFIGRSVRPVINESVNINPLEPFSDKTNQAIYNIYGIKVDGDNLKPGMYIQGGKKYVVR